MDGGPLKPGTIRQVFHMEHNVMTKAAAQYRDDS